MVEGEVTDQLVAGILDWTETTDQDRDDLDRWLRRLVTRRGTLSPAESAIPPWTAAIPATTAAAPDQSGRDV
jgi:hypothetical protein